ncbi:MAG TPA: ABC transporter permease, partial [Bryobacteraceae bacterium]|nr:ABC transporter permease [Bryobacteraceae bacterium]
MLRKFLNLFRPNRLEADLREELEFHRAQTSGSLGNVALVQDRMRDASTIQWLETTLQDIRYGFRQLGRAPVLVAAAVVSLALGIGANTAIFTLINAFLFQFLPVHDPARLVLFRDGINTGVYSGDEFQTDVFSYPFYEYLTAHNDSFEDLCPFRQGNDRVILHVPGSNGAGPWERAKVHLVSGNYFRVLGVSAAAGRVLVPADDSPNASRTAVLSY